jgi:hemerythrin-like domain-containing protein
MEQDMAQHPQTQEPASPITGFSDCHAGILRQLDQLDRLPALVEAAQEARRIATETINFFRDAVLEHHGSEERELFPAVLSSAAEGEERRQVIEAISRLTAEHRRIEAAWSRLEGSIRSVAKGRTPLLDLDALDSLVRDYKAHARHEEDVFLPLSERILGRNDAHMAALGLALHMRQSVPDLLERLGHRI